MDDAERRWHGRRVLVTGCTGFLGGWTVTALLSRGAEVVGLVRDRTEAGRFARHGLTGRVYPAHGKIEDTFRLHSTLAINEVSAVFHLAADPTGRGAGTVAEAVRRYDPRVPVVTASPAGEGQAATDTRYPVPFGIARFGEVFGPGDGGETRPVARTVLELLGGTRTPPPAEGPREYVFAADAARACVLLAESLLDGTAATPTVVEFRSGWELTPAALAAAVWAEFDGRADGSVRFQPGTSLLGWCPAATFTDALRETIAWYRGSRRARFADQPRRAA
jgi:CDP-glucose 4,6-dehydratase